MRCAARFSSRVITGHADKAAADVPASTITAIDKLIVEGDVPELHRRARSRARSQGRPPKSRQRAVTIERSPTKARVVDLLAEDIPEFHDRIDVSEIAVMLSDMA